MPSQPTAPPPRRAEAALSQRQAAVLRALVAGYVGAGAPMGSKTLSHLVPESLSSASVRNVLADLTEMGLVEKPHASAGRVPTERGLRLFVDALLAPADLAASERRDIAYRLEDAEAEGVVPLASELLSHHTGQLGFVVAPRVERLVLRHVSLVRLSSEKLLVVMISRSGAAHRRIIRDEGEHAQAELDRMAALLNERVAGRSLAEVRDRLQREARALRREANRLLLRALELGTRALSADAAEGADVVIETRLALLHQPEFSDPRRLRDLFEAIETKERLLEVLRQTLADDRVSVAFGDELEDPALRHCAVVVAPYGASPGDEPLGALGVIGPSRMDYARVISLVDYLAHVIAGKLGA